MKKIVKHLWLITSLIVVASVLLLMSDREQRVRYVKQSTRAYPSIAIMQIASTTLLDTHVAGVLSRLEEKGFRAPDGKNIRLYNPQGDYGTANAIARDIANSPYDMVITSSTVALQVFSKANISTQKAHVFGGVTDPYGTGVGITGPEPDQHPAYMAGVGTFQPVKSAIRIAHANGDMSFLPQATASLVQRKPDILVALSTPSLSSAIAHSDGLNIVFGIVSAPLEAGAGKSFDDHLPHVTGIVYHLPTEELFDWTQKLFPRVKRIGALYNPSEANSAREIVDLKKLLDRRGIELIQMAVYSTSEVPEGIRGLLAKNVDLVFSMADNTVANGMPAIIKAGEQHGVPIIAEDIALMGTGALISCAPGPYNDGRDLARLTTRILLGESPANIPFTFGEKKELTLDLAAMKKAGIAAPVELLKRADLFFNLRSQTESPARIAVVNLVENASLLLAIEGVEKGLAEMGLREGTDFILKQYCAQADMSQLSQILDQVKTDNPDALITVSTPVFIAAVNKQFDFPLIFTVASDPDKLGLFKNGRPANVCGVYDDPPVDQVLEMAKKADHALSAVGIIYDASQMNSLISVEKLRKAGMTQHVKILEATASTVSDLPMATQAVIQRGARAIILSADNLAMTGFPAIYKVAQSAGIPIYGTDTDLMDKGAAGVIGDSYFDWGRQSGHLAAKVIAGVLPSQLPIRPTNVHNRIEPKHHIARQASENNLSVYSTAPR